MTEEKVTTKINMGGGKQERNRYIDIVKGIGIVLMVLRHARAPHSDFVLLFHMSIFFIASGYLTRKNAIENFSGLKEYCIRKIKGLYFPYVLYSGIFVCLNNVFLQLNIYTDDAAFLKEQSIEPTYKMLSTQYTLKDTVTKLCQIIFLKASTQIGGALWFFQVLLIVLIVYATFEYILCVILKDKKKHFLIQGSAAILLLIIGYYCSLTGKKLHGFNRVCSVYILVYLGSLIKQKNVMEKLGAHNWLFPLAGVSFISLCVGYHRGYIALDGNHIDNPLFFLLMSSSGWFLLYAIAVLMEKHRTWINEALIYISRHSVVIVALHFLAFKIVNIIIVECLNMPKYMIAAFPVLTTDGTWWMFYFIVGVVVPLGIEKTWWCMKQLLCSRLKRRRV